jgi:putative PIN family toxin of toxin-antitoxin system
VPIPQVVLDTNVLVAGLRSRRGASFRLLERVGTGAFDIHLSVPLVVEYEDVLSRQVREGRVSRSAVDAVLDFHCEVARRHHIFFLWRPILRDPHDDMVLELAVKAGCDAIITYNERDFAEAKQFGIRGLPPATFLKEIGVLP